VVPAVAPGGMVPGAGVASGGLVPPVDYPEEPKPSDPYHGSDGR
jgi:hypothetical protein